MAAAEKRAGRAPGELTRRLWSSELQDVAAALPGQAETDAVARRCKVLADPTRLRVLAAVRAAGEIPVSDVGDVVGIERSVTSHHLRRAEKAGLVTSRTAQLGGRLRWYRLTRAGQEMVDAVLPE